MANKDYQLDLKMRADFAQARSELRRADTAMGRLQQRIEKANIAGRATNALALGFGTAVGAAALAGVAMMGKYIANSIEAEKVQAQLQARIKDTAGAARRSLEELNAQADALQNITVFDDEAIGGVQAMLLTFKQIQGVQFDRATAAVLDLSTAMGMDLNSAALQLGKALNDPIKGLTALGRSGVQFSEDQTKVIKRLVETGQTAKAQELILNELEAQMGTAAEAARDTLGGAITALKNAFDNLLEGDTSDGGLVGARQAVEDLIVTLNDPDTKRGFDNLINGAVRAIGAMVRFAGTLANTTKFVAEEIAARANGPAIDDTIRIEDRIARIRTTIDAVNSAKNAKSPVGALGFLRASELVPGDFLKSPDAVIARLQGELDKEQNKLKIGVELNEAAVARAAKLAADAAKAADVAVPKPKPTENPDGDKPTPKGSDPDAAIRRRIASLREEAALLGQVKDGEDKASEAAKARYAVTAGDFRNASPAMKAQLVLAAEALDQKRADIEAEKARQDAIERSREAYQNLLQDLRTPAEVAVDTAVAQLDVLNQALKDGAANKDALDASLGRVIGGAFTAAPEFQGLSPEVGGPFSELWRIDESREKLDHWYQEQLDKLALFRQQRADLNAQWDAKEAELAAQHQAGLQQLQNAQTQVMLAGASSMFGGLADISKAFGGEQSKTYRALFALSKGFAVAQAAVALAQNVAEASKVGFPQNLVLIAGAFAQGAQIASMLAGANYNGGGGFAQGGYTGPGGKYQPAGTVHKGEGVLNQGEIASLGGPSGFYALRDAIDDGRIREMLYGWAGYADGGLVAAPRQSLPSPDWTSHPQGGLQPAGGNRLNLYNLFDMDALAQKLASHPAIEKRIVVVASENGSAIRAEW